MNDTPDKTQVVCTHCLTTNRIPRARAGDDPVCGSCGQALLDGAVHALDESSFDRLVARTDLPVLVDFWAAWCGPCRAMAPQFEAAAKQLKGRALLVKVDSDAAQELSRRFGIRSIPTLLRLERGVETDRQSGAVPAAQIAAFAKV